MKLKLHYKTLRESISLLSSILKSRSVSEKDKLILVDVNNEEVTLYAFTPTVVARTVINPMSIEVFDVADGERVLMNIPLVKLNAFLDTFNGGNSVPTDVTIAKINDYEVGLGILEEFVNLHGEEDVAESNIVLRTQKVSNRVLENLSILRATESSDVEFHALSGQQVLALNRAFSDLLPYVQDKNINQGLIFKEDKISSVTQILVSFTNFMSSILSNGMLSYHAVSTLKDLTVSSPDGFEIVVDDQISTIVVRTANYEVGIRYDTRQKAIPAIAKDLKDDNSFSISREQLSLVLKRISSISDESNTNIVFKIDTDESTVEISTATSERVLGIDDLVSTETVGFPNGLSEYKFNIPQHLLTQLLFNDGYSEKVMFSLNAVSKSSGRSSVILKTYDESEAWSIIATIS